MKQARVIFEKLLRNKAIQYLHKKIYPRVVIRKAKAELLRKYIKTIQCNRAWEKHDAYPNAYKLAMTDDVVDLA